MRRGNMLEKSLKGKFALSIPSILLSFDQPKYYGAPAKPNIELDKHLLRKRKQLKI